MKIYFCFSFILASFFLAAVSHADFTGKGHVHKRAESKQEFFNADCASTDSCDLKRFTLTKVVNEIWFSDNPNHPTYANGVIMEYETATEAALEKYAIVQFKKGCVFDSTQNPRGEIHRSVSDTVASFGEPMPFCFRHWVIDSQDNDPVYNSDPEYGRFYLIRWNRPDSYDNRTEKYYGAEKPKLPVVYMADYPAGAFVSETAVRNVALEFNTCIYKANEVPAKTRRENINFAKPVSCFHWQNVYVYDFAKASFHDDLAAALQWAEPTARGNAYRIAVLVLIMGIALILFRLTGGSGA